MNKMPRELINRVAKQAGVSPTTVEDIYNGALDTAEKLNIENEHEYATGTICHIFKYKPKQVEDYEDSRSKWPVQNTRNSFSQGSDIPNIAGAMSESLESNEIPDYIQDLQTSKKFTSFDKFINYVCNLLDMSFSSNSFDIGTEDSKTLVLSNGILLGYFDHNKEDGEIFAESFKLSETNIWSSGGFPTITPQTTTSDPVDEIHRDRYIDNAEYSFEKDQEDEGDPNPAQLPDGPGTSLDEDLQRPSSSFRNRSRVPDLNWEDPNMVEIPDELENELSPEELDDLMFYRDNPLPSPDEDIIPSDWETMFRYEPVENDSAIKREQSKLNNLINQKKTESVNWGTAFPPMPNSILDVTELNYADNSDVDNDYQKDLIRVGQSNRGEIGQMAYNTAARPGVQTNGYGEPSLNQVRDVKDASNEKPADDQVSYNFFEDIFSFDLDDLVDTYSNLNYEQLNVVKNAYENGLNSDQVNFFAKPEYNEDQMAVIASAIQDGYSPEDISFFAKPEYNWNQMQLLFNGWKNGVSKDLLTNISPKLTSQQINRYINKLLSTTTESITTTSNVSNPAPAVIGGFSNYPPVFDKAEDRNPLDYEIENLDDAISELNDYLKDENK